MKSLIDLKWSEKQEQFTSVLINVDITFKKNDFFIINLNYFLDVFKLFSYANAKK